MRTILFAFLALLLVSCTKKREVVENLRKNENNTLTDYIKELGEPISARIDSSSPKLKRVWHTFVLSESSKTECELDLYEGKKILDFIVEISFEKPMEIEYGCIRSQKELKKVKEDIMNCVKDKIFSTQKLTGGIAATYEFKYDMTYVFSSYILGGFASSGTWEIFTNDLESATIILTPPEKQVASGYLPSKIYLTAYKNCTIQIGETTYTAK